MSTNGPSTSSAMSRNGDSFSSSPSANNGKSNDEITPGTSLSLGPGPSSTSPADNKPASPGYDADVSECDDEGDLGIVRYANYDNDPAGPHSQHNNAPPPIDPADVPLPSIEPIGIPDRKHAILGLRKHLKDTLRRHERGLPDRKYISSTGNGGRIYYDFTISIYQHEDGEEEGELAGTWDISRRVQWKEGRLADFSEYELLGEELEEYEEVLLGINPFVKRRQSPDVVMKLRCARRFVKRWAREGCESDFYCLRVLVDGEDVRVFGIPFEYTDDEGEDDDEDGDEDDDDENEDGNANSGSQSEEDNNKGSSSPSPSPSSPDDDDEIQQISREEFEAGTATNTKRSYEEFLNTLNTLALCGRAEGDKVESPDTYEDYLYTPYAEFEKARKRLRGEWCGEMSY